MKEGKPGDWGYPCLALGPSGVAVALDISVAKARVLLKTAGFADLRIGKEYRISIEMLNNWIQENRVCDNLRLKNYGNIQRKKGIVGSSATGKAGRRYEVPTEFLRADAGGS